MAARGTTLVEGLPPLEVVAALDGDALLLDLRVGAAEQAGIPGAVPIHAHDLVVLASQQHPTVAGAAPAVDPHLSRGRRIILYCQDGDHSSRIAATLFELGYEQVAYLLGGVAAWIVSGLGVELPTLAGSNTTNEKEHES